MFSIIIAYNKILVLDDGAMHSVRVVGSGGARLNNYPVSSFCILRYLYSFLNLFNVAKYLISESQLILFCLSVMASGQSAYL